MTMTKMTLPFELIFNSHRPAKCRSTGKDIQGRNSASTDFRRNGRTKPPWFALGSSGVNRVEPVMTDLKEMFLFAHLGPEYRERA
jgi:hypothetical protein